jgi:hypothetical protein
VMLIVVKIVNNSRAWYEMAPNENG